jgi:hypothetical protein
MTVVVVVVVVVGGGKRWTSFPRMRSIMRDDLRC